MLKQILTDFKSELIAAVAVALPAYPIYCALAWLFTGIALGFNHAFLPWDAQIILHAIGLM